MAEAVQEKSMQTLVHEALEKHHGNRAAAAQELGMTLQGIKNKIYESPRLRARWANDEVGTPDQIDALVQEPVTVDQKRFAAVIEKEDERLKSGLAEMGLSDREMTEALALQKFNRQNFASIMDIFNAGMAKTAIKLLTRIAQIEARLEPVTAKLVTMGDMAEDRDLWTMEEEKLALQYVTAIDTFRKITQTGYEGSKTLAIIKWKLAGGGKEKKAKPGFQAVGDGVINT
jgi:hypothetical protein